MENTMPLQAPRGTSDILPESQFQWNYFREAAELIASIHGYEKIDTPIFEYHDVFSRAVGTSTDVMEKETYTFKDRGEELITLRPEGTAPVCRAFIEHGMHNSPLPIRLFYISPIFRYERPQSGRYRQHHQFGMELLGSENPEGDAEVISAAWQLLKKLGLKNLNLLINSIGDSNCRPKYMQNLISFYSDKISSLCTDCERRFENNPLRLLDCKNPKCQEIIDQAPKSIENLCKDCAHHWDKLCENLDIFGLTFSVDNRLVRGFDYYTRTVFEIIPPTEGRMSTLAGGGRYDGLISQLGGKYTPGMGFGMGIERVLQNLSKDNLIPQTHLITKVLIIQASKETSIFEKCCKYLSVKLRDNSIPTVLAPIDRSVRSQMRYGNSINASHAIIIGESELSENVVTVRNFNSGEQLQIPLKFEIDASQNSIITLENIDSSKLLQYFKN